MPLRTILVKLGEAGVKDEDIPKRLDEKADELIKLRAKVDALQQGTAGLAAIAQEAQALIAKGDLDGARRALAARREASRTRRIAASREDAEILALEARVDDLQLAYRSAAAKYAEAASLVAPFDAEQQWRFLLGQARELRKQGDEFGDNAALAEAIDVYRQCLDLAPRSERPLDWASTQNNLGTALFRLGERESGTGAARRGRRRLSRSLAGKNPRARAARLGHDPDESRQCARSARRAGERDGKTRRGRFRLSRSLEGKYPRTRAARLGRDHRQPRRGSDASC
jgi:tetratricopeptide (TPR) repeat protein